MFLPLIYTNLLLEFLVFDRTLYFYFLFIFPIQLIIISTRKLNDYKKWKGALLGKLMLCALIMKTITMLTR